ncbi:hypothetical protein [Pseudoduganella buxea]|uniref:Uncharacterized protein n=1 Tax=Pseudoduganella buxea TaxID=1949069 RepID=A0A6I3SW86_9BURK|nr:hypothetical protein [Pseudoduganella buxea]MTV53538.1 hypothetical protein [Pseudoduganella buxea]GGC22941.1 hypothetical protein GCM10011572_50530 [Pseudoduganella buxea]
MKYIGSVQISDTEMKIWVHQDECETCVWLFGPQGSHASVSKRLALPRLGASEFFAKTYSGNSPLREPLLNTGLFIDTGRRVPSGFVDLEVWRLTHP